jgi:hypothetical protein
MKICLLLSVIFIFLLSGCSSSQQGIEQDSDFLSVADDFLTAFNSKDVAELNKYVDKDYGLFVVDNPGAASICYHLNSFTDIMSYENEYGVGYLKVVKINCSNPRKGLEPIYDCDKDGWNKQGCFYGTQKNINLVQLYKDLIYFDLYTEAEANEPMRIAAMSEKNFVYFIYNTDENIGFYFGLKDGKYYLIAIDKVEPCSA